MRIEDQLRTPWIGLGVLEQFHQLRHKGRMQACLDLIDQEHIPMYERVDNRTSESKPYHRAERLLCRLELDIPAHPAVA